MEDLDNILYTMVKIIETQVSIAYKKPFFSEDLVQGACSVLVMAYGRFDGTPTIQRLDDILAMLTSLAHYQLSLVDENMVFTTTEASKTTSKIVETCSIVLSIAYDRKQNK